MEYHHKPVLYEEVLECLAIQPAGIYVDGTFGRGGHSQGILSKLGREGKLFALDKDPSAIQHADAHIHDPRFTITQASFVELARLAKVWQISGKINGVVLDLGVSSPQLDDAERGFSFQKDGPLDMRMDPTVGVSASEWLNRAKESEIAVVLKNYGEERFANRIAKAIVAARELNPITRTGQLAEIIKQANPSHEYHKHPATRSFQGIRIYINRELAELEEFLQTILDELAPAGRLCILSFHSLEDRIVKRYFRKAAQGDNYPKHLPIKAKELKPAVKLIGKDFRPSASEYAENIRSRSAIMRVVEKVQ